MAWTPGNCFTSQGLTEATEVWVWPKRWLLLAFPSTILLGLWALEGPLVFISLEASVRKEWGGREMWLSGTQMDAGI